MSVQFKFFRSDFYKNSTPAIQKYTSFIFNNLEESALDARNHGFENGYGSFIYYSDTFDIFCKYKKAILTIISDSAKELGYSNPLSYLQENSFFTKRFETDEIVFSYLEAVSMTKGVYVKSFWNNKPDLSFINSLVWLSAEIVLHSVISYFEDKEGTWIHTPMTNNEKLAQDLQYYLD